MGLKQRDRLWPVFEAVNGQIAAKELTTGPGIFTVVANFYRDRPEKPFTNIVVDEAQDLGLPELPLPGSHRAGRPRCVVLRR